MSRLCSVVAVALVAGSLIPGTAISGPAVGPSISFFDLADQVTASATGCNVQLSIDHGNVFGGEDDVTVLCAYSVTQFDALPSGNTVYLFEPNAQAPDGFGVVSDIIDSRWVTSNGNQTVTLILDFGSDPAICNEPGTPSCVIQPLSAGIFEDGSLQSLNGLLSLPPGVPGVTVFAQSDAAPEPATLALLGVGLAGIGFSRRRKSN